MQAKPQMDRAARARTIAKLIDEGKTLRAIGKQFGISHERVRQIDESVRRGPRPRRAIDRMRLMLQTSRTLQAKQVKTGYGKTFECASYVLGEFHRWLVNHEKHVTIRRLTREGSHSIETVVVECFKPVKPKLSGRASAGITTNRVKDSCLKAKSIHVVKRPTTWAFTFLFFTS